MPSPSQPRRRSTSPSAPIDAAVSTRGNSTILIGARLLEVVASFGAPASLKQISGAAGMSPSSAYRYARALCDAGLLSQDGSGMYDVGPKILQLGLQALNRIDPLREAGAMLTTLSRLTGQVSALCIWSSAGPLAFRCDHEGVSTPWRIQEGITLPLLRSAPGKLFLTYLPDNETASLLSRERATLSGDPDSVGLASHAAVEKLKQQVRKYGLSRTTRGDNPRHDGLAAPVFDRNGRLALTLSLIGIPGSIDLSFDGQPAAHLKLCAQELSTRLGAAA